MKSVKFKSDMSTICKLTLVFFLLMNVYQLLPILNEGFLFGDDNTSNFVYTVRISEMLRAGNFRFWFPDYSMGQPLFFYYQPIPHLLTACVYLVFPFLEPILLYKALIILGITLIPLSMYIGMRWMNFTELMCLIGALVVCSVSSWRGFGFEVNTLFRWGQYSHLWGLVLSPLVIGYNYKNFFGERKLFLAVVSLGLLFLTHAVMGIVACAAVGSLFLISSWDWNTKTKDLFFFIKLFTGVGAIASIIILPNMLFDNFVDGFSTVDKEKHFGIGLEKTIQYFWNGNFFDKNHWKLITPGVSIGIVAVCFLLTRYNSLIKTERQQVLFLIVNLLIGIVLISGTQSFPFLKYTPVINSVLFLRLLPYIHFIGILLLAFGFGRIIMYAIDNYTGVSDELQFTKFFAFSICLLSIVLATHRSNLNFNSKANVYNHLGANPTKSIGFAEVIDTLNQYPHGRIHMEKIATHFELHLPPLYADKPITKFVAASSHTNLGLYYLKNIDWESQHQMNLFNIQYLLSKKDHPIPDFVDPILKNDRYNLSKTTSSSGYFDIVHANTVVQSHNQAARKLLLNWMERPELLEQKEHIALSGDLSRNYFEEKGFKTFISLKGGNKRVPATLCTIKNKEAQELLSTEINEPFGYYLSKRMSKDTATTTISSEILEEYHEDGYYRANIAVHNVSDDALTWAMVKVNAHPDWTAKVDGKEVEWVQMSPCFMAVPISRGIHTIEFKFGISPIRKSLLLLAFLTILGLGIRALLQNRKQEKRYFEALEL